MGLAACKVKNDSADVGDNNNVSNSEVAVAEPVDIIESFFTAFEKADYESMKLYCTEKCINTYFHSDDVFGMIWAKAAQIAKEPESLNENECRIFVDVEMETAKTSALYGESETSFYVTMKRTDNNLWLIDTFVTG
jgi:hypothetical protein